ncbi:MAG TPA: helix-turn-helix domain-containing protein [Puia sp.]|jgi:AraC-like DNA-binding protein|nr:helix-turn-helix domain-containing protein [Puia sp.]
MRTRRNPYTTTLYLWNDISAMFYSSYITPFHSHNTLQLIIGIGCEFRFRTPDTAWNAYKCLLIKEDVIHKLDTSRGVQLIVYIESCGDLADCLRSRYLSARGICSFDEEMLLLEKPGQFERCMLSADSRNLEQLVRQLLYTLRTGNPHKAIDERVKNAIRIIAADRSGELKITRIAQELFLSESRLRPLFKTDIGISLHRYILLHKSRLALTRIMNGASIAEAAAAGGFADSSHFHRVLLNLFGVSPSRFMKENEIRRIERVTPDPLRLVTCRHS